MNKRLTGPSESYGSGEELIAEAQTREEAGRSRAEKELRPLHRLKDAIAQGRNPNQIVRSIRDIVVEEYGFDRAAVYSFDAPSETMRGVWGTDAKGRAQDISKVMVQHGPEKRELFERELSRGRGYYVKHFETEADRDAYPLDIPNIPDHAIIFLISSGELVGCISLDNLLTQRPILESQIEDMLPFAEYASLAMLTSELRLSREEALRQQERSVEIRLAITANEDIETIHKMVRNAIVEIGFVDRASVWVIEGNYAHGTWGTDENGAITDEHGLRFPVEPRGPYLMSFANRSKRFEIDTVTVTKKNGEMIPGVPHAFIPLVVANEIIGMVAVDTLFSRRNITPAMLASVVPIADQAALAIQRSQLSEQREAVVRQQKVLMDIAAAIASNADMDSVYLMVRDAILRTQICERAGVWLVDGDNARGTWGTGPSGEPTDEHGITIPMSEFLVDFADCLEGSEEFMIGAHNVSPVPPASSANEEVPCAAVPLKAEGQLIGVITLDNAITRRPLSRENLELILPLAKQAAVAMRNNRLLEAAEQEIRRRSEAEALLLRQAQELIVARDAALAGARTKSQFLANMSHEIRTPMNGVMGLSSMLMETELSPKQSDYLRGIKKSAASLLAVIDDILDFSRLEAGMLRIVPEPFSLRECIEQVVEVIRAPMKSKEVAIHCSISPELPETLLGDAGRVRQMVTNLVGNAVKFTDRGEVSVQAEAVNESGDGRVVVEIRVRDTGIGIPENRQKAVFESFTQADGSPTRRHDGSGLGLTITKQLVELMGGTIDLESRLGEGSTFWLRIPFEPVESDSVIESAKSSPATESAESDEVGRPTGEKALAGLRILLAEDNPVNSMVASSRLEMWGCTCVCAENGQEALQLLRSEPFDLILMDLSMPVMDGIQATAEVRRMEETLGRYIPIIAMTAHALQGDRERCLAAGLDDYLSKPVNFDEMFDKIRHWSDRD